jgi:putative flippase GtrA
MNKALIKQVLWFAGIGAVNTGVDFVVLNVLMLTFGAASGFWYIIMKSVSFLAANANSYFLNTRFTFPTSRSPKSFGVFFVATLVGLCVNVAVAYLARIVIIRYVGDVASANIAALVGTVASMVVNFILYKYVVFTEDRKLG